MALIDLMMDPYYRQMFLAAGYSMPSITFDPPPVSPPPTTEEHHDMSIEVGKIVTRQARDDTGYGGGISEEAITVTMDVNGVMLELACDLSERATLRGAFFSGKTLTPEQAIELGQILLKAAEVQTEYAESIKLLDEERAKLNARYKDMISGLGIDADVDVEDAHNTFKVITAS